MNTKTLDIIGITFIAQNVALISPIHVLRMCGVERQPAQADRLARSDGGTSTPLGHDWNSNWISDENNHWHECNVCAEKGDVGVHIWDNGTITISPTCTTEGERKYTCIGCGRIKTETIQATGHDLVHHDAQAANCTANGWEAYDTCSNCDYTTYTEIPATGHSYGEVKYTWSTDDQHCTARKKMYSM